MLSSLVFFLLEFKMIYYHRVQAVFEYLAKTSPTKLVIQDKNYEYNLISKNYGPDKELNCFVYSITDHVKKLCLELNICNNGVIFGEIKVNLDPSGKQVSPEEPEYVDEKELIKYIDLLINRIFSDLQKEFDKAITVREMLSIPPGANPYHYDSIRMGCDIGQNWQAMFHSVQSSEEDPKPSLNEIVLINTKTGRRFHLDLTLANEPVVVQEEKENSDNTVCSKIVDVYRLVRD